MTKLSMEKLLTQQGLGLMEDLKSKSQGNLTPGGGRITPADGERKNASALDNKAEGGMDESESATADSD